MIHYIINFWKKHGWFSLFIILGLLYFLACMGGMVWSVVYSSRLPHCSYCGAPLYPDRIHKDSIPKDTVTITSIKVVPPVLINEDSLLNYAKKHGKKTRLSNGSTCYSWKVSRARYISVSLQDISPHKQERRKNHKKGLIIKSLGITGIFFKKTLIFKGRSLFTFGNKIINIKNKHCVMKQVSLCKVVILLLKQDITVSKIALALNMTPEAVISALTDQNTTIDVFEVAPVLYALAGDEAAELLETSKSAFHALVFSLQKELLAKPLSEVYKGQLDYAVSQLKRARYEKTWEFVYYKPTYIADHQGLVRLREISEIAEWLQFHGFKINWKFSYEQKELLKQMAEVLV